MKRFLALILASIMLLGLAACGDETPSENYTADITLPEITGSCFIAAYTRNSGSDYSSYIAESVHFALSIDGGASYQPLFNNYGMLFAKCHFSEANTIISAGVKGISLNKCGDSYYISAKEFIREKAGSDDNVFYKSVETGKYLVWETKDFINFSDGELSDSVLPGNKKSELEGEKLADMRLDIRLNDCVKIEIPQEIAKNILYENMEIKFSSVKLPENAVVSSEEDLRNIKAEIVYSDGSVHSKRVEWDLKDVNFNKPGEYTVSGTVQTRHFPFPVEERPWGDPDVIYYNGKYYFIATDDRGGQTMFEAREADTPEALFDEDVKRSVLLEYTKFKWEGTFWAPEFHVVDGKLCIFAALSKHGFDPQSHVMVLRDGGDVMNPADWSEPQRCTLPDGRFLGDNPIGDGKGGITLDMTYFKAGSKHYAAWSYRTWSGGDSGSMILIGEIDPNEPWKLLSEPTLLTRPEYGWENVDVTDNNEGPNPIVTDDKIYLVYSGGNAGGDTYVLGMLTADIKSDLLKESSWVKSQKPVLASNFVEGQYGCGHCAFFIDEFGDTYITYHGHKTVGNSDRIDGIRRVHFKADGEPHLWLTEEQDLPEGAEKVVMKVTVE
jgi:GH43 family beta-xylosidase